MPRSTKCRRVCQEPKNRLFFPENGTADYIVLSVEELEAIRLCDLEGLDQDTAAERMEVSRGTFQRILYAARKKTASALCGGKGLKIEGGNYEIAQGFCDCLKQCKKCIFKGEMNHE